MDATLPRTGICARRLGLLPERGKVSLFELVLLLACIALVATGLPQNLQDVMIQAFLWAGFALAWNIAGGYAGLISFGHAAFFGIGAYTSTILGAQYGLTPWIGLWLGAFIAQLLLPPSRWCARACAGRSSSFRPWPPRRWCASPRSIGRR